MCWKKCGLITQRQGNAWGRTWRDEALPLEGATGRLFVRVSSSSGYL